jgi:hypothetical protein
MIVLVVHWHEPAHRFRPICVYPRLSADDHFFNPS